MHIVTNYLPCFCKVLLASVEINVLYTFFQYVWVVLVGGSFLKFFSLDFFKHALKNIQAYYSPVKEKLFYFHFTRKGTEFKSLALSCMEITQAEQKSQMPVSLDKMITCCLFRYIY